jgi:photosystem II stability/assembly factor-like uncharacterized protein
MLLIAVLAFVLATWDMLRTPPRYDVSRKSGSWAERMFSPIEANAIRRLPVINARLNALSVNPAGTEVCVVGDQGFILATKDAGITWQRLWLQAGDRDSANPAQRAASFLPPLVGTAQAKAAQKANPTFQSNPAAQGPIVDSAKAPSSRLSNEQSKALLRTRANARDSSRRSPNASKAAQLPATKPTPTGVPPKVVTWSPSLAPDLVAVHFIGPRNGWVLGRDGTFYSTSDGGVTWNVDRRPHIRDVRDAGVTPGGAAWILSAPPRINDDRDLLLLRLMASGAWDTLKTPVEARILPIGLLSTTIVPDGDSISILASTMTGMLRRSPSSTVWRPARTRNDAIAQATVLMGTAPPDDPDSLLRWTQRLQQLADSLGKFSLGEALPSRWAISMAASGSSLFAVNGLGDLTLRARDWSELDTLTTVLIDGQWLRSVRFDGGGARGWVVGMNGTIWATRDSGVTWFQQGLDRLSTIEYAAVSLDLRRVDARLGNQDTLTSLDGGEHWSLSPYRPDSSRRDSSIVVPSDTSAMAMAAGEMAWSHLRQVATGEVVALRFDDSHRHGLAVLAGRTALSTSNGGRSWHDQAPYQRWPKPAYYFVLVFVLASLGLLWNPPTQAVEEESIADTAASDRPLRPGDYDALKSTEVAIGLSHFIQNRNTEPPLTIAITGQWGSGKSSIMNLLEGDLSRAGARPVWFNAWHHQKEQQMFAALLESVRAEAVPPAWQPRGLWVRLQLMGMRGFWGWTMIVLISLAIASLVGLIIAERANPSRILTASITSVRRVEARVDSLANQLGVEMPNGKTGKASDDGKGIPGLLVAITAGYTLWRRFISVFGAFGAKPSVLFTGIAGIFGGRPETTPVESRARFARQFDQVVRALHPQRVVILIDDLDRCSPENVLETLEAVNFLVSEAECIVVLGMYPSWVEACVGVKFKDIAEEVDPSRGPKGRPKLPTFDDIPAGNSSSPKPTSEASLRIHGSIGDAAVDLTRSVTPEAPSAPRVETQDPKVGRRDFARSYIEKLVNLEVPVPRATQEEIGRLLQHTDLARDISTTDPEAVWEKRIRSLIRAVNSWTPRLAMAFAISWGALMGSTWLAQKVNSSQPAASANRETAAITPDSAPTGNASPDQTDANSTAAATPTGSESALIVPGTPGRFWPPAPRDRFAERFIYAMGIMTLLVTGLWRLTKKATPTIGDSARFKTALGIWDDVVFLGNETPRAAKRYRNRVRYYAMRERTAEPSPSWIARAYRAIRRARRWPPFRTRIEDEKSSDSRTPEGIVVALGALAHVHPAWIEKDVAWNALVKGEYSVLAPDNEDLREAIAKAVTKHEESLGEWPPQPEQRARILEFAEGAVIAVNGSPSDGTPPA